MRFRNITAHRWSAEVAQSSQEKEGEDCSKKGESRSEIGDPPSLGEKQK